MLSKEEKKLLIAIAEYICEELVIPKPKLIFKRSDRMTTPATKGMVEISENGNIVYLDTNYGMILDIIKSLAHELRHIYQFEVLCMQEEYMKTQTPDKLSLEDYNMLPLEIDAHAYSEIFVEQLTGCTPLWYGFSGKIKKAIKERKATILAEEYMPYY